MSNINLTVEQINQMDPLAIVNSDAVHQRFVQIYDTLWGEGHGEPAYQRESLHFNRVLSDNEPLRTKATRFSIFTAFIDLAVCGLSVEPGARAQCYLQPKNYAVGTNPQTGKKTYEGRCVLVISGYGELVMRTRCGQIKYADNPVLVYDEDSFSFSDNDGQKSVRYTCNLPHVSNHIKAAFMKIVRNDGSIDYAVMFEEDWLRLKGYSAKANQRWDEQAKGYVQVPNALYSSNDGGIDTGFLMAKVIKHAFRSYPKVRIGKGTELQSQEEPEAPDYYGVEGQPSDGPQAPQQEAFGDPARDMDAGVTVQPKDDDGAF